MDEPAGPFPQVPSLRAVPGLQVRHLSKPVAVIDPIDAAQAAAQAAGYTVLSRNRRDLEKIAAAALAASYALGECDAEYNHLVRHRGDVIPEDWNQGWTVFVTKALMAGLGFVTPPQTEVWDHPQSGRRYLRFIARTLPLRPVDPPVVVEARRAATS